jgi:hypothetical protein
VIVALWNSGVTQAEWLLELATDEREAGPTLHATDSGVADGRHAAPGGVAAATADPPA